jgi:hypothetical protein
MRLPSVQRAIGGCCIERIRCKLAGKVGVEPTNIRVQGPAALATCNHFPSELRTPAPAAHMHSCKHRHRHLHQGTLVGPAGIEPALLAQPRSLLPAATRLGNALPLLVTGGHLLPGRYRCFCNHASSALAWASPCYRSPLVFGAHFRSATDLLNGLLRLRLHRNESRLALDYQDACGAPSQFIHDIHLAMRHRISTWRPFLECGGSLVVPSDSTVILPPTLRAVRGASLYVRTSINRLQPCESSTTSIQLALPRLTPLSLSTGNVFAFRQVGIEPTTVGYSDRCSTN